MIEVPSDRDGYVGNVPHFKPGILMNWLQHAFDTSGPDEPPTPAQLELIENLSQAIVRRQLALPAMVFLEMSRPLNTLSAQALHFLAPMLEMFSGSRANDAPPANPDDPESPKPPAAHTLLAQFLERPDAVGYLCDRIEAHEKARVAAESPRSKSLDSPNPVERR